MSAPPQPNSSDGARNEEAEMMPEYESAGGLLFAIGVSYVCANLYVFVAHTASFPVVFVCQFIPLLLYRVFSYYHHRWHHYCLDFCYCLNALHIIYVLFMPHNQWLFTCAFILANGPVIWGALVFTNKLVFHDIESMFSLVMHLGPALATHAERFYWGRNDFDCPADVGDCSAGTKLWSLWALPCAAYAAHLVLYTIYVWLLPIHAELRKDPRYDNTFLYIRQTFSDANKGGTIHTLFNMFGSSTAAQYTAFAGMNLVAACVFCGVSVVCFQYRVAHVVLLVLIGFSTAYFGGTFYFHFFNDRYVVKFFSPKPWTLLTGGLRVGFPLPFLLAPSPVVDSGSEKAANSDFESSGAATGEQNKEQHQVPISPSDSEHTGSTHTVESLPSAPNLQHSSKVVPECATK